MDLTLDQQAVLVQKTTFTALLV